MGLFINTLPVRLSIDEGSVVQRVRQTHQVLADLLRHEHASLALAQRCSGVQAPAPLFSALFNYRHNRPMGGEEQASIDPLRGVSFLHAQERTNYPITLSVEDFGQELGLTAQVLSPLSPERICEFMHSALSALVQALEEAPQTPLCRVDILPSAERHRLLVEWNATDQPYPSERCIHELFEEQVHRSPGAIAVMYEG